jgi:hypothetical protein
VDIADQGRTRGFQESDFFSIFMLSVNPQNRRLTQDRRLTQLPEEENSETVTELLETFLDNLNADEDCQLINKIHQKIVLSENQQKQQLESLISEIKRMND